MNISVYDNSSTLLKTYTFSINDLGSNLAVQLYGYMGTTAGSWDNVRARKYDPDAQINITYGSEESGSWTINGVQYTKRKLVTLVSNKTLTDYQVGLNSSEFNSTNITMGVYVPIASLSTSLADAYETEMKEFSLTLNYSSGYNAEDFTADINFTYNGTTYTYSGTNVTSWSQNVTAPLVETNTSVPWSVSIDLYSSTESSTVSDSGSQAVNISIDYSNISFSHDPAIEGQEVEFTANFAETYASTTRNISGTFYFDGSNTTATCASTSCSANITIGNATALEENKTVTFYWSKTDGTDTYNYTEANTTNLTVYEFLISECNATVTEKLGDWYLKDELNSSNVTGDAALAFTYTADSSSLEKTTGISFSSVTNFSVCVYPSYNSTTFYISSIEDYSATNYKTRHRYMRNASVSTQMADTIIYLLPTTDATEVQFSVKEDGVTKPNVDVEVLKFFTANSTYVSIGQIRIGSSGYAIDYVDTSAWYKFKVYDTNGSVLYETTDPEQIVCPSGTTCTHEISYYTSQQTFTPVPLNATCTGNKTANTVLCSYVDSTGRTHSIYFKVEKSGTTICESNITGSSGQMLCDMTAKGENLTTYVYDYKIYRSASPEILAASGFIDLRDVQSIFDPWVIGALAFVAVLSLAFYFHPGLAVAGGGVAIFASAVLGVFPIGLTTAAMLLIGSLVIAWRISR